MDDAKALDRIAALLRREEWSSGADMLEWIAEIVSDVRDIVNGTDDLGNYHGTEGADY